MTFNTDQDKQLWIYAAGEYRVPVYATPGSVNGKKHWRIVAAVFLKPIPFDALSAILHPLAINKFAGYWIIPEDKFVAAKADGVTPEYYFKEPTTPPKKAPKTAFALAEAVAVEKEASYSDDFIKDVWQRTAICELATLRLIWLTLCQEMPRWMMNQNKPINIGWARMVALPYRVNWKQIVLARFPRIWAFLKLPDKKMISNIEMTDFPLEMISTSLTALSKAGLNQKTIRWTVELEPNALWWEYQDTVELRVLEATGKHAYIKRYASLLHRMYPLALEIFRSFVKQTTLPSASILRRRGHRGRELVDNVQPGEVRPRNPEGVPVCVTTDSDSVALRDSETGCLVEVPSPNVPQMSVVDFNLRDVWDAGGDDGHAGRDEEPAGVLVQPEAGGETPEEGLLGAVNGVEPHRVAGQLDAR